MVVYYARFRHKEERKWYCVWVKEHRSGWGVHRLYLPERIAILQPFSPFWELDWSSCDNDHMPLDEALGLFEGVCQQRFNHGYELEGSGKLVGDTVEEYPVTRRQQ